MKENNIVTIGIDPGITGALAMYDSAEDLVVEVFDLPTTERIYGKGKMLDADKLYTLLYRYSAYGDLPVYIENVGTMPNQGVVSAYNFGHSNGIIQGVLAALPFTVYYIHPATWKKLFGLVGSGKDQCRQMILQAYPYLGKDLALVKNQGRADAIAIAIAGSKYHRSPKT